MAEVKITTEDIQAAMVEDPKVALRVQVIALTRALDASEKEVAKLTDYIIAHSDTEEIDEKELTGLKNGKNAKEK